MTPRRPLAPLLLLALLVSSSIALRTPARSRPPAMLAAKRKGGAPVRRRKPQPPSPPAASAPPSPLGVALVDPAYESLRGWLEAEGAKLGAVAIADFGGLRGLMATRRIDAGEEIVAVPARCAVDLGAQGDDPLPAARALLEARARDAGGAREPYYATLPQPDSPDLCTPDFWGEATLELCQWPPLAEEVRRRAADIESALGGGGEGEGGAAGEAARRELQWAVWLVQSRVLTVQGADGRGHKLLIPWLDMFNHRASSPHRLAGRTDGMLRVLAGAPVGAGEQVEIVYGTSGTSNAEFLGHYGFLDPAAAAADEALLRAHPHARPLLKQTALADDEAVLAATEPGSHEALALGLRVALKRAMARSGVGGGFGRR